MNTKTLLPIVRVSVHINEKRVEKYFTLDGVNDNPSIDIPLRKACKWIASIGATRDQANIYFIPMVNGEWRTDWELTPGGQVLPHPWATQV